ncbi:MAG: PDZ domain-containing protein [Clostridiales bacterium]|nr:MAG: PDZ domain-containing protein [Clostridiales bacterium]
MQTNESAQSEKHGRKTPTEIQTENIAEDKSDGELNLDTFENSLIDRTLKMLEQTYKYDVEAKDVYRNALRVILAKHPEYLDDALKGIFSNLDPHSEYYTAEEYNKFIESINNEYYGIGVIVTAVDGGLKVVRVIKNSPASGAGIKKDDLIVCVGGVNIVGMGINEAKSHIIGEKGSEVSVDLIRDGENMTFSMKRDLVNDESGFYDVIDGKIGYILLYSFEGHSSDFISEALSYFDTLGITKVIFRFAQQPRRFACRACENRQYAFPPKRSDYFI